MPIYEYECMTCGIHFDRLQHFSDVPPEECPRGHNGVRKVLSPPLIIFKGHGFYSTDHPSKGNGRGSASTSGQKHQTAAEKES